jgi:2-polyprenyl-3-methyl-5-hydroxy-6-metoxy-1,4-benzoquinol methylase
MTDKAPSYFGRDLEAMSFARNYHRWILDEYRPHLGVDLAEIGAGSGNFSEMLLSEPQVRSLVSFEPSANMFPHLARTLSSHGSRARAVQGYLSDHSEGLRSAFDTVLYVNVLEHVPALCFGQGAVCWCSCLPVPFS